MIKNLIFLSIFLVLLAGCTSVKQNSYTVVTQQLQEGVLLDNGYVIVKPQYDRIYNFNDENEKYKHPHMLNLHWLHDGGGNEFAVIKRNNKYGVINKDATMLLKPIYDNISSFFNGFARIEQNGKVGLVNDKFEIVLKPKYESVEEFYNDVSYIKSTSGLVGCIDKNMKLKIKPQFDRIYLPVNNYAKVRKNKKWGFVDKDCNIVVQPIYEYVYNFSNNISKVIHNGKISYLNLQGKQISKVLFDTGNSF